MLRQLSIENYALIRKLEISFAEGFSVLTGETGAGKSIILGALGLILGERADTTALSDPEKKCVVEGCFSIEGYGLEPFFVKNDIDYDNFSLLRREINSQGKSRAFINDTPVTLSLLKELGEKLVDIHSQHENLLLKDKHFQLEVLDSFAGNYAILRAFKEKYKELKQLDHQLAALMEQEMKSRLDEDYFTFLFQELNQLQLIEGEQDELEKELSLLNHSEEIKTGIFKAGQILEASENNILTGINEAVSTLQGISAFMEEMQELANRLRSVQIEVKDIISDLGRIDGQVHFDASRAEEIESRLDQIYGLLKKHHVNQSDELLKIKDDLDLKLNQIVSLAEEIEKIKQKREDHLNETLRLAEEIHLKRQKASKPAESRIIELLQKMGMPDARFNIVVDKISTMNDHGMNTVNFLFNANKGSELKEVSKIASGGELSRVMLAIKSVLSGKEFLPTIIFDEIDLGVSGKVADMVGNILKDMANNKQVLAITHLPQIAAKGSSHYYVYKNTSNGRAFSGIEMLNDQQRIDEIARMISGENVTDTAMRAARELLANN